MGRMIGIDLGTSTTEAAVLENGKPIMLLNYENKEVTPSAVGTDEKGEFLVGEKARARYLLYPESTAIEIKRKIGTNEKIPLGGNTYTATELSAKLLAYVREYASAYLDEKVTHAVISVPAYFDEIRRQATIEAGRQAGLIVERILNEPTAAALCYGLGHMEEESYILVYDLGGGTFDVTLLEMFDGVLEVKASSGDNQLGGKDFDQKLIDYLALQFERKHGVNLRRDPYAMVKLKENAEWCKKELSTEESCRVLIPMIAEKNGILLSLDETVTRARFEEMSADLIVRTHHPIDVVMADSGISRDEIAHVLLVGGSTRIPMVARDLEDYLGIVPQVSVNPDYAVAEGAAIQAGMLEGALSPEEGLMMTDVNPYTLGVRSTDGYTCDRMSVVIPRNVTIPVTRTESFSTAGDYQTTATIEVYQGESLVATHNHFLGAFEVSGIPPKEAGREKLNIEFSYNLNGMLNVKAVIVSTGEQAQITINMQGDAARMEEEKTERIDVSGWRDCPGAKSFRAVIRRAERVLKTQDDMYLEEEYEIEDLDERLYQLKKAIVEGDMDAAGLLEIELMGMLED